MISAPLRPKYVAKGYKKIYIADFIVGGEHDIDKNVNINVNKEIKETLKSEFKDKSGYEIEDLKIEIDKSKKPEDILKDASFWASQKIDPERRRHDPGRSSGFLQQGEERPCHGARNESSNRTCSATSRSSRERLQLILSVNLYLIDATNGEKLFQENFREEETYDDVSNVSLPLFYDVFERMTPKIVGILVPYRVAGTRTLLEP